MDNKRRNHAGANTIIEHHSWKSNHRWQIMEGKSWMVARTIGQSDGRLVGETVGRSNGRTDGLMDGRMGRGTDGRTVRRLDGRTDGRSTFGRTDSQSDSPVLQYMSKMIIFCQLSGTLKVHLQLSCIVFHLGGCSANNNCICLKPFLTLWTPIHKMKHHPKVIGE